jgi:hypothetical protein
MADLASLGAYGFSAEEVTIALDHSGSSVTAGLVLLLQRLRRLAPESGETAAPAEADLASEQHEALQEEAVALGAIYGDAFCLEALPGGVQCLRLQLPELQPVAGELRLLVPPGCAYPSQPCLPLFVPSAADGALDAPGVRIALAAALAQQAARLAADCSPACYELSTWLAEGLPGFLAQPPPRPPPLLLTAKQQAKQQHGRDLGARHQAAAEAASDLERHREREAAALGLTFEEYLKATDAWPICQGTPDPIEVAALKARLAAGRRPEGEARPRAPSLVERQVD